MTGGWKMLHGAAHWFKVEDGRSLCGRWLAFTTGGLDPEGRSPDDCRECRRRLALAGKQVQEQGERAAGSSGRPAGRAAAPAGSHAGRTKRERKKS